MERSNAINSLQEPKSQAEDRNDWVIPFLPFFFIYILCSNIYHMFLQLQKALSRFFGADLQSDSNSARTPLQILADFSADPEKNLCIFKKYPELGDLFRKYNTAIPSSAPCERLFSIAKHCLQLSRLRILDKHFEAQLLVHVAKSADKQNKFENKTNSR